VLTVIQATHASLRGLESVGLLERHRRLLRAYAEAFEVHVYSGDAEDYTARLGVTHHPARRLPRRFFWHHLGYALWLVRRASEMKGVIKVFGSNIPTLSLVRSLSGLPMMVTYQWDYARQTGLNEGATWKGRLAPLLERLAVRPADLVLVTAPWLEERIRRSYARPTVLLANWVDLEGIAALREAEAREESLVLFAGRLHWSKGGRPLLRAFARVHRRFPGARLILCGEGEERAALEAERDRLGLSAAVFEGRIPQEEVLRRMCRAAVVAVPTQTMEGHPKALIEAMACGAACVVSDVPGNRELIRHGVNGLLVSPRDEGAWASAIESLLADPGLRSRLGREAETDARQFAFAEIVPREIAVLRSLLESRDAPARRVTGARR